MKETLSLMAREVLYVGTNLAMLVIFMNHIFEKKRSEKALIIFLISKVLLVNVFFHTLLLHLIPENAEIKGAGLIAATFIGLLSYLFLQYTYKANLIVIIISGIICEILAICMGNLFSAFLNLISGRKVTLLDTEFHITDLLFPVLSILTMPISCKIFEPLFARLRRWKVKHPTPLIIGILLYFLTGVYTNLGSLSESSYFSLFCIIAAALLLFFWYVQFFYRKVRREKEYLEKQQKLSKLQYSSIALQIEKMEAAQLNINGQMQRITEITKDLTTRTQQLESYIRSLKIQKEAIMHGMFCDSWLLDSVLCHHAIKCKDRHITADFRLWGYKKGMVQENALAELVHYLLEAFLSDDENTTQIALHMASVKGQIVIRAGCVRTNHLHLSNRKIRKYMRGHQTTISRQISDCPTEITIIIE